MVDFAKTIPSTQFSHLTPRELKKVLLTRLNAAAISGKKHDSFATV